MILFDHIAIAVPRLQDAPAVLVGQLGGTPAYGAASGPYRFFQWRYANGGRLEVLEPVGADGFLHRFIAQHGPGIHHVTFKVPSLKEACARAEAHGYRIVGYDDSDPEWAEAFLHPREALGIVVQLAESHVDGETALSVHPPLLGPPDPPPPVTLLGIRMRARSPERAARQWGGVLEGRAAAAAGAGKREPGDALTYRWPGSPMRLVVEIAPAEEEGPVAVEYAADRPVALGDGPDPVLGAAFVRGRP